MNACEIIRNHTFWPRSTLQPFSLFVFLPVVACFLCVSVSTFGLSSFIRVRPITFLAAVLFIRWSEINCPGLELDYKGRCHSHPPFAFSLSLSLSLSRVVSSFISGLFRTFFGNLVPGSSYVFIFKTRWHVCERRSVRYDILWIRERIFKHFGEKSQELYDLSWICLTLFYKWRYFHWSYFVILRSVHLSLLRLFLSRF